ncbi:hypothetical protein CVT25_008678 [Psilocybe cyanescens]|uniref:Uncharacterized protein n=1 Tax=Psilocybe cyanescens TaxID=93625 RepID=A0A409XLE4_PSICY|nr:hypothetical protein CVT25_008678 [Psilocybe cyanescens]
MKKREEKKQGAYIQQERKENDPFFKHSIPIALRHLIRLSTILPTSFSLQQPSSASHSLSEGRTDLPLLFFSPPSFLPSPPRPGNTPKHTKHHRRSQRTFP